MQSIQGLVQVESAAASSDAGPCGGPGRVLSRVFETLDRAGILYCVLHGYENYPQRIKSDVDCVISSAVRPTDLAVLFHNNRLSIGAEVVRTSGYYFVLAGKNDDDSPCFLDLHFCVEYDLNDRHFYRGSEILESRRQYKSFWVPSVKLEFGSYLVKKLAKGRLEEEQQRRLSNLYQQDPAGCQEQIARFWGGASAALINSCARSGHWGTVESCLKKIQLELNRRATTRHPWRMVRNRLCRITRRFQRLCLPVSGLNVIFLGPDGAGKSSVTQTVGQQLGGAFAQTTCQSFPPELLRRLLRRPKGPDRLPHAAPPRSFLASVIRAVFYWFAYYTLGYCLTDRLALARATLVLHDRHLIDAVVDSRRYRYGGPQWLLRMIRRLVPKSDLVILLDAPPEVLQSRKQEVPFAETMRQREAYLALVATMKNGCVVDAARPLAQVVDDVNDIFMQYLTARIARRYGLEQKA